MFVRPKSVSKSQHRYVGANRRARVEDDLNGSSMTLYGITDGVWLWQTACTSGSISYSAAWM